MAIKKLHHGLLALCLAGVGAVAHAAAINVRTYDGLSGVTGISLEGINCPNTNPPTAPPGGGCVADGIQRFGAATVGERFAGQQLGQNGNWDTLSGTPQGPLTLMAGTAGKNLLLIPVGGSVGLGGMGNAGADAGGPLPEAAGEGAVSILFDGDQSQFGVQVHSGSTAGRLFLAFFRFDGSLIDSLTLTGLRGAGGSPLGLAFARDGGVKDIAGVSIWNEDNGGLFLDGFLHDVTDARQPNSDVPEPSAALLAGLALAVVGVRRARRV